jgi:hypothetical protein
VIPVPASLIRRRLLNPFKMLQAGVGDWGASVVEFLEPGQGAEVGQPSVIDRGPVQICRYDRLARV